MPLINTVTLAGAGGFGSLVLDELLRAGLDVTVLSRSSSSSDKQFPPGTKLKHVDYSDVDSLAEAVTGADVVISTVRGALDSQENLIRASAKAGVKLFVPAEFGNPSTKITSKDHPVLYRKHLAHDLMKEVGLPALLVFNGAFLDVLWSPFLGFDFAHGKVNLVGQGNTPVSLTARRDVARFLAHYLVSPSSSGGLGAFPPAGEPAILRIEGDKKTFRQAAETYARVHGVEMEYEFTRVEDAERVAKDVEVDVARSMSRYMLLKWERGAPVDEGKGEGALDNKRWPEWKPISLEEFFKEEAGVKA
ncbi:hypothetical protein JCM6882_004988 [Rhodosporidiobolus microsporus]